jgi:uncharacterized protein (DUF885 family)
VPGLYDPYRKWASVHPSELALTGLPMTLSRHHARLLLIVTCLVGLVGATATARPISEIYDSYWQDMLRLNPTQAIQLGERSALAQFDDSLRDDWQTDMVATLRRYRAELQSVPLTGLTAADQRSARILRETLDDRLQYYDGPLFVMARLLPTDQFQGPHLVYAQDAAGSGAVPFRTIEDYDLALRRADAYARWVDEAIGRLREGARSHIVLPRLVVERMLPQLAVPLGRKPEKTEFWRPITTLPADVSPAERVRLESAYRAKIATVIQPAYLRLYDYLANEYLPQARETVGLSALPNGRALYERRVREHTTTDLTPEQIHALGRSEVERILGEIDAVQRSVGFVGTRAEFFQHVRDTPDLHFNTPEEVVPAYQAATARIVDRLPTLFGYVPTTPYEIRPLPKESSLTFQGNGDYAAPAADGSRPGILWMNIYASGVKDRFNVMTIALHEGLPGHHFQASVALNQTGIPAFRRSGNYTAFVEGWGLYAESLGKEMGLFDDPWQYYGHLNYAILRANRLVVDTGLHAYGWSVDDGVRWMTEHSSMTDEQARAEVERYVAYPAQALAYKVGELKIRALRNEAEHALGRRFDVRAFHDRVLASGPVPLTDLETDIRDFIQRPVQRPGPLHP